jgi:asparagine synthase (glutamine-hydrolysing)
MGNLIGWMTDRAEEMPPAALAETMIGARALCQPQRLRAQADACCGVAIDGGRSEADVAQRDGCRAAIVGRPYWSDPTLAAAANRHGHAEALLGAFLRSGERCLDHLRGAFALAVLDQARKRAFLAIDRYGIHSLCFTLPRSGGLVFGTRTDSVRAHPAVSATISEQSLFNYLFFGVCPSPGTIYREHVKLLPAQCVLYKDGHVRTEFYWQMPYRERTDRGTPELCHELLERLSAAVNRATAGTPRATLGAFLSGGLDSSTVTGLLSRSTGGHAKTFTIGFAQAQYDESGYAEIAAKHFKTTHHLHRLSPGEVTPALTTLAGAFDEPFGNSSVVPAYFCAKLARDAGVTRILAGDGGDEIFAGNSRYVDQLIFESYKLVPKRLRHDLIEPLLFQWRGAARLRLLRKAQSFVQRARVPLPDRMETYNFLASVKLESIFAPSFLSAVDPGAPLAGLREVYQRTTSSHALQRMLHVDLKLTLADNDLRKVGVACALANLEVDYPFLDDDVVEFSASIPPNLLIRHLERRWFFKQAVRSPAEILAKRKHGFGMPFAEWPRQDPTLRDIAQECLTGFSQRGYCRPEFVTQLLGGPEEAIGQALVWDIMMLELWLRSRSSGQPATRPNHPATARPLTN